MSMGIHGNYGMYRRTGVNNNPRKRSNLTPLQQQQVQNKKNAGKAVLTIAAIIGAIKFRKPIGKLLAPAVNAVKTKFPNFSNALSAVKNRASRMIKPLKDRIPKNLHKRAAEAVGNVARDTVEFTRDTVIPNARKAAGDAATYTRETIKPNVMRKAKNFFDWIAQKANSDIAKPVKNAATEVPKLVSGANIPRLTA